MGSVRVRYVPRILDLERPTFTNTRLSGLASIYVMETRPLHVFLVHGTSVGTTSKVKFKVKLKVWRKRLNLSEKESRSLKND